MYAENVCNSYTHGEHAYQQQQYENKACTTFGICHSTFHLA